MMRRLNVPLVVLLCGLTPTFARAQNSLRATVDDLTRASDLVATGHVMHLNTRRDPATSWIYTYVTIELTQVIRGSVDSRAVVLKQLGGTVGDESMVVPEQARFAVGEDVLFFAETRPRDQSLYTASLWQGKWTIERDPQSYARIATRAVPASDRGLFGQDIERREFSLFVAAIRSAAGKAPPVVKQANLNPDRVQASEETDRAVAPQFAFFDTPGRWNEFDARAPIPVDVQVGGQPGMAGGGISQIVASFGLWSAATPLQFVAGGGAARCAEDSHTSRHIAISFMDPCGEISDTSGTFAIAGYFCVTNGGITIGGVFFCRNTGAFIINSNAANTLSLYTSSPTCFQAVQTHMIGHALGLGHSTDPSAIMYATILSSCHNAAPGLGADDVNGIRFIYPSGGGGGGGTIAPGTPSGLTFTAARSNVTVSWNAPAAGGAVTGYIIEAGSSSGLSNLANFNTGSAATTFTAQNVPAGRYFVRVRATNAAGTSAVSNEVTVVVTP